MNAARQVERLFALSLATSSVVALAGGLAMAQGTTGWTGQQWPPQQQPRGLAGGNVFSPQQAVPGLPYGYAAPPRQGGTTWSAPAPQPYGGGVGNGGFAPSSPGGNFTSPGGNFTGMPPRNTGTTTGSNYSAPGRSSAPSARSLALPDTAPSYGRATAPNYAGPPSAYPGQTAGRPSGRIARQPFGYWDSGRGYRSAPPTYPGEASAYPPPASAYPQGSGPAATGRGDYPPPAEPRAPAQAGSGYGSALPGGGYPPYYGYGYPRYGAAPFYGPGWGVDPAYGLGLAPYGGWGLGDYAGYGLWPNSGYWPGTLPGYGYGLIPGAGIPGAGAYGLY